MAIYHLHVKVIQRSKGKNVISAAAYRRATKFYDEKEERHWDYTNKKGVIHSEILAPENSPDWLKEIVTLQEINPSEASQKLWNLVDVSEKRKDAQLAREIEFALPIELNEEQNIALAREFIHDQFVLRGMVADWNVHWDEGNPHVHVMLTMRELRQEGLGQKVSMWNSKILLQEWREQWAAYANFHLRLHEHQVKIDHRSYEEQGIELIPTVHQGKAVSDMERRGIPTEIMKEANHIRQENLARISAKPKILFDKLSSQRETFTAEHLGQELGRYINDQGKFSIQGKGILAEQVLENLEKIETSVSQEDVLTSEKIAQILKSIEYHESVFTERDIVKAVEPFTNNAEQFAKALIEVKTSSELIYLGPGDDGRDRFTTQRMFALENEIQKYADVMRDTQHIKISSRHIHQALEKHQTRIGKRLTEEQLTAVNHILKSSSISCVVGRAGTGKSFSLGAAKQVWESKGLRVLGVALSGIAADGLNKDAEIDSRTIESFRYAIQTGALRLTHHDVVVMDEAGMTDSLSMASVLSAVREARAKLVLVGDHAQIQPVGPGASFRALIERLGFAEIQTVYRQKEAWQREATVDFSAGRIADGLSAYETHNCIHFEKTAQDAMSLLVDHWLTTRTQQPKDLSQYLVVAHRNEDVRLLNQLLRTERVKREEIAEGYSVNSKSGHMNISQGDRILFLKNDRKLGVSNGRFATIKSVEFTESGKVMHFTVTLDGTHKEVRINPNQYQDFAYGYAATVHKVQGMTVDHAFVYAGGTSWNRHLTYVALSRHRESCHLYADKSTHHESKTLYKNLARLGIKDSLLDFPLTFAERRGIDTSFLQKILPAHLIEKLKTWKSKITSQFEEIMQGEKFSQRQEETIQSKLNAEKITRRREDARDVAAYVDAHREMGRAWQSLQEKLSLLGLQEISYESQAFSLISQTKEYLYFQQTLRDRNAKAFTLNQDPTRYQKALDIYSLDLNQLKNQAEKHAIYERVKHYTSASQKGKVVYRDKIAAEIFTHIKNHYPYLKEFSINSQTIRLHAISHLKRQAFTRLSSDEKYAFVMVEKYLSTVQETGAWWSTQIKENKTPLKHSVLERLEKLNIERERLAHHILSDREKYDKALDFYHIGLATERFNQKPTEKEMQQAEKRWYQLQQYAARHELRERVEAYHQALFCGETAKRMALAAEIMQDTKAHHFAVVGLGANTKEVWQSIRQDFRRYTRSSYYQHLNEKEKIGFKTVETYIEAKKSHAMAWREIFGSKKTSALDEKSLYQHLTDYAKPYTQLRNELAAKIIENPKFYEAGINFFKVEIEELQPQAYVDTCRRNVENYLHTNDFILRTQQALKITHDPKSHHGFIIENGFQWRHIYREARIAERKNHFDTLTSSEKSLYRLSDRYRKVNKKAGVLWSAHKDMTLTNKHKNNLDTIFAKRDYLAWRLVNDAYSIDSSTLNEFCEKNRLSVEKLLQQHEKHTERLTAIERYQKAYQNAIQFINPVFQSLEADEKALIPHLQKAFSETEKTLHLQKIYHFDKPANLQYALEVYGVTPKKLIDQMNGLKSLKEHLQRISVLKQIDQKQLHEITLTQQKIRLSEENLHHQKIDIKRLREDLNVRAQEVTLHYLGEPRSRQGNTWRYGSHKGSLVVTINGTKQGLWRDFQTNEGGDMLSLIHHATSSAQFKETLQEGIRFLGGYSTYIHPSFSTEQKNVPIVFEEDAYTFKKIQKAQAIYKGTQGIEGTLAEKYLREHRGIHGKLNNETFRYHPKLKNWMTGGIYPALVIAARDEKDQVCGVQAIFLDPKTAKKAPLGNQVKLSRGLIGAGALVHKGQPSGKVVLAEGPETALSVAEAHPDWTVHVTFGVSNFDKVGLKTASQQILIAADNDGRDSGTAKSVSRAANLLSRKGIDVFVAEPIKPESVKKWDFNDALLKFGVVHVKQTLDQAPLFKAGVTSERLAQETKDILSRLPISTQIPDSLEISVISKIDAQSLHDIFKGYVEMEIEQTRLVNAMHSARLKEPKNSQELVAQALSHSNAIHDFAKEAVKHPEVQAELEKLKNIRPQTLAQRGGFMALRDKVLQKSLTDEDIQVLTMQLRNKASDLARSQARDRDRGGRSK